MKVVIVVVYLWRNINIDVNIKNERYGHDVFSAIYSTCFDLMVVVGFFRFSWPLASVDHGFSYAVAQTVPLGQPAARFIDSIHSDKLFFFFFSLLSRVANDLVFFKST